MKALDLRTRVGRVELVSPVLTASGTSGHGSELARYMDLSALGAVTVKSLSAGPWDGNPSPRLHPVAAGMLNSVGLENPGMATWLAVDLPALAATGAKVVASIWGFTVADYRQVAAILADAVVEAGHRSGPARSIVAVEANISCPNIEDRRHMFAHCQASAAAAVEAIADGLGSCGLPLWAKLSPNVTDLPAIAGAVLDAGADALTLVNTLMGLALDPVTGRAVLGAGGGGLSGPALHPVAVRAVFECRRARPEVPIVGVGGVTTGADAAELLAAGADAVSVGTATFSDPRAPERVSRELATWCRRHHVRHIRDLVGRAHGDH
ncbi:MAG: dihydroorotate dehydrogenase [Actinomycetota bacterium]|nr:dihydroorotate dehydrogenase [Actinomycetota bacterium]